MKKLLIALIFLATAVNAGELKGGNMLIDFDNGIEISRETMETNFSPTNQASEISEERVRSTYELKSIKFARYSTKEKPSLVITKEYGKSSLYIDFSDLQKALAFKKHMEQNDSNLYFDRKHSDYNIHSFFLAGEMYFTSQINPEVLYYENEDGELVSVDSLLNDRAE